MKKIKIFYSYYDSEESEGLEEKINDWIEKETPNITDIFQSATGRIDQKVIISIWYTSEETKIPL